MSDDEAPPLYLVLRHPGRVGMKWHVVFASRSRAEAQADFDRRAYRRRSKFATSATRLLELRGAWPDLWRDTVDRAGACEPPGTPHLIEWPGRVDREREGREERAAKRAKRRIAALAVPPARIATPPPEALDAEASLAADEDAGEDVARRRRGRVGEAF